MLAKGLTEDGAAQALGWSRVRVSARMRLLELPQRAQEMVGDGTIALSGVDQLRAIGQVSPALLDAVIDYLSDGNEWAAERLCREPGWVLDAALRRGGGKVFAAHLTHLDAYEIAGLKKTAALVEEAAGLHKQIDRYAYGAPTLRFTEQDVDQARAAGVVIEFDRGVPVIVDRGVYRELAKQAITRSVEQLRVKAAAVAAEKKAGRQNAGQREDPVAQARREEQRQLRELSEQGHGVNLDLGVGLLNGLSVVDPGRYSRGAPLRLRAAGL